MNDLGFVEHDCERISIEAAIDELQDLRLTYIPKSVPWQILEEAERLLKLKLDSHVSNKK